MILYLDYSLMSVFEDRRTVIRRLPSPRTSFFHGRTPGTWCSLRNGRRKEKYTYRVRLHPFEKSCRLTNVRILLRLGIFIGFAAFFIMEKSLRVFSGEGEHGHSHSHSHITSGPEPNDGVSTSVSSQDKGGLRSRSETKRPANGDTKDVHEDEIQEKKTSGPSKLSAYLNLFGDFVHNM